MGLPGRPRAARRRREGSCCCFPPAAPTPRPGSRAPLGAALPVCREVLVANAAWHRLAYYSPARPPASRSQGTASAPPAPRAPPTRPPRPSPPTSPDPKFWRRGESASGSGPGWRRLRTRGVPSVFLKSTLPAAAAAPAAESLGLQPGGSQVSRKTESAGRAPGEGLGMGGAYLAGSRGVRACVWLALRGQSGFLYGKVERSSRSRSASASLYTVPHTVHATRRD